MGLMYAHSAPLDSGKPNWDLAEVLEPPEVADNDHDGMRILLDYNRKLRKAMEERKPPRGESRLNIRRRLGLGWSRPHLVVAFGR